MECPVTKRVCDCNEKHIETNERKKRITLMHWSRFRNEAGKAGWVVYLDNRRFLGVEAQWVEMGACWTMRKIVVVAVHRTVCRSLLLNVSTRLQRVRNSSTFTRHYALSHPSKSYSIFNVIQKDLWLVDLSYLIHLHLSTSLKYRKSAFIHSL